MPGVATWKDEPVVNRHWFYARSTIAFVFILVGIMPANDAIATVLYRYESVTYNSISSGPYSGGMNVTGFIELEESLGTNFAYMNIASLVLDFDFFDGVRSYTPDNSMGAFAISTDSEGMPLQWLLQMADPRFFGSA